MKIAYKFKKHKSEINDWEISVIYDYLNWPERSLAHKGLSNPDLIRDMTKVEIDDFDKMKGTRCFYVKYKSLDLLLLDEETCKVDSGFINELKVKYKQHFKS